jgi:hypothetical protein
VDTWRGRIAQLVEQLTLKKALEGSHLCAVSGENWVVRFMSALPPKADIRARNRHVRFVPLADIGRLLSEK